MRKGNEPMAMLKTILVDDEIKALERISRLAVEIPEIQIVGAFQKPKEALAYLQEHPVDLALLDIEMPDLSGLELAEAILEVKPEIDTVFLTAYDQYALEAFQANAVGYLLKPIEQMDMVKQVERILRKKASKIQTETSVQEPLAPIPLTIQCFGGFYVFKGRDSLELIKWRTSKAEELFALLLHYQGKPVSRDKVLDLLWPDMDFDRASKNLHAISYYIRETLQELGYHDLFVRNRGQYQLRLDQVRSDYFKADVIELLDALDRVASGKLDLDQLEALFQLDHGEYFEGKDYNWAISQSTWCALKFDEIGFLCVEQYLMMGNEDKAIQILIQMIQKNPIQENAYVNLIEIFISRGDRITAKQWYQFYENKIREELQIEPSGRFMKLL